MFRRVSINSFSHGFAFLLAFVIAVGSARAEQLNDTLTRFESVAIKSSRSLLGGKGDSMTTVALLGRLRGAVEASHWQSAIQLVHEIQYKNQAPEVVQLCGPLLETLRKERVAREDAVAQEMEKSVKKAGELLLTARAPKEVDPIIAELTPLAQILQSEDTTGESDRLRHARAELGAAQQYVRVWQDYLQKRAAGKEPEAAKKMESLAQRVELYPVVARSELLARETAPGERVAPFQPQIVMTEIFANAKSLDDLDAIGSALQNWQREQPNYPQFRATAERVAALRSAYGAYIGGRYGEAFEFFSKRGTADERLMQLEQDFLLQLLPGYLTASGLSRPQPNERPSEYLLRLAREAAQKQDWPLALRTIETFRSVAFGSGGIPSWVSGDVIAFGAMVKAERQERAGEFAGAVASYRAALESSGQNVPVDFIGEHLRALRKNHPEAFVLNEPRAPDGGRRRD
jgi:hypothetical protein